MKCQRCSSDKVLKIVAKCSDLFSMWYKNKDYDGYIPECFFDAFDDTGNEDWPDNDWR